MTSYSGNAPILVDTFVESSNTLLVKHVTNSGYPLSGVAWSRGTNVTAGVSADLTVVAATNDLSNTGGASETMGFSVDLSSLGRVPRRVECDVAIDAAPKGNYAGGVLIRAQDANNYIACSVGASTTDEGVVYISEVVDGSETVLASAGTDLGVGSIPSFTLIVTDTGDTIEIDATSLAAAHKVGYATTRFNTSKNAGIYSSLAASATQEGTFDQFKVFA